MLGPDRVSEIYPTIDGGTTFYMDMSLDDPTEKIHVLGMIISI